MAQISYVVRAICRDAAQRATYLAWLVPHHIEGMRKYGASAALVTLHDTGDAGATGPTVEARYTYPSREAFDAYVRDHSPVLRGDSLKHFPPDCGIIFERRIGEVSYES